MPITDAPSDLLKPAPLKRPLDPANMGQENAALRGLVGMLNDPNVTGAVVPAGEDTSVPTAAARQLAAEVNKVEAQHGTLAAQESPEGRLLNATPLGRDPIKVIDASKVFYTGRLKAGKDYIAQQTGAKNFGFSEPLYFLLGHFFGVNDKDKHGARKFLQYAGQVGRGVINEQYPLSAGRAVFEALVRTVSKKFDDSLRVEWKDYGRDNNIWLDAVNRRIDEFLAANPGARVSNTNVRFEHEFTRLREQGFKHYHVMCSRQTWEARLKAAGLQPGSPILQDVSEQLAMAIDADVTKKISAQRVGKKLNVIWNDENTPPPSPRLYTVKEFLSAIGQPEQTAAPSMPEVNTVGMVIDE